MALDVGVIAGYLALLVASAARRVTDRVVDGLLDRFGALVEQYLDRRTLARFQSKPNDLKMHREVSRKLVAAAAADQTLATKLQAVIRDLDRHGGRTLIKQVYTEWNVRADRYGVAIGKLNINAPDRDDWSRSPGWVKTTYAIGASICVLGLASAFLEMSSGVVGFPMGMGIFMVGFVFLLIGALGRMMSGQR